MITSNSSHKSLHPNNWRFLAKQPCLGQAREVRVAESAHPLFAEVAGIGEEWMTSQLRGEGRMHAAMLAWPAGELQNLRELLCSTIGERLQDLQVRQTCEAAVCLRRRLVLADFRHCLVLVLACVLIRLARSMTKRQSWSWRTARVDTGRSKDDRARMLHAKSAVFLSQFAVQPCRLNLLTPVPSRCFVIRPCAYCEQHSHSSYCLRKVQVRGWRRAYLSSWLGVLRLSVTELLLVLVILLGTVVLSLLYLAGTSETGTFTG